eukprot:7519320-Pyramimonas_sp.AAC.1
MVTATDILRVENKQDMCTVVYNPECNLKPQDVSANKIDFDSIPKSKLGVVQHARARPKTAHEPKTYIQAMTLPDADMWDLATTAEMNSIDEMKVFDYGRPPPGAKIIGSMFVYKRKLTPDGSLDKYKARLVAFGHHQVFRETCTETFAQLSSSRLILNMAMQQILTVHHMDIRTAYLQSEFSTEHEDI